MPKRIAILGGGIAGLSAAYELTRQQQAGADLKFTLFEATDRLGGIVDTVRTADGFVLEGGPDGWVSEKPWARDLAIELGLESELVTSNDAERVTYILRGGKLLPMPDRMRMMVPTELAALEGNPLFSDEARRRYRQEPVRADELKAAAPLHDESVAMFVDRHFGAEVLDVIGAPLLNGVFGGDVHKLSVQAVMQPFVQMEREHGSLIVALQRRDRERGSRPTQPIFTSLRGGVASLTEAIADRVPSQRVQRNCRVVRIDRLDDDWKIHIQRHLRGAAHVTSHDDEFSEVFDVLLIALPIYEASSLLTPVDPMMEPLLNIPGSSALTIALAFTDTSRLTLPKGFGFLAPPNEGLRMLAATFSHQKFPSRAPAHAQTVRVYYGGDDADRLHPADNLTAAVLNELECVLGPLPSPSHTSVRYWPRALPQYHVGHPDRMAKLDDRVARLGGLYLLGNGYRGVGLPDLIRDARAASIVAAR